MPAHPNLGTATASPTEAQMLHALQTQLVLGQGQFTLAFVSYDQAVQRAWLTAKLRHALSGWTIANVSLQDPALDLRDQTGQFFENLKSLAARQTGGAAVDAVFLLDWDRRLVADAPFDEQPSTALVGLFNMGRNHLEHAFSCPVVVFVVQEAMTALARLAPDFVSWQSGSFYVPFDPQQTEADIRTHVQRLQTDNAEAVHAAGQLELYAADLATLSQAEIQPEVIAGALDGLAASYLRAGDPDTAGLYANRLYTWAEQHRLPSWRRQAKRHRRQTKRQRHARQAVNTLPTEAPWDLFRGATSLEEGDAIYGREEDVRQIVQRLIEPRFRLSLIWGETGCGKTSLIRAGVMPALRRQNYLPVYVEQYEHWEASLSEAIAAAAGLEQTDGALAHTVEQASAYTQKMVVLFCDQFERIFPDMPDDARNKRAQLLRNLTACVETLGLNFHCVLMLRADQLYHLTAFDNLFRLPQYDPLARENRYELGWLRKDDAARVLERLRDDANVAWDDRLIDAAVAELARNGRVRPVEIQLVAAGLFLRNVQSLHDFTRTGGVEGLLKDYLNAVFETLPQPDTAPPIVRALVAPANPPIRLAASLDDLTAVANANPQQAVQTLNGLEQAHLVQHRDDGERRTYELVHDILIEPSLQAASAQETGLRVLRNALSRQRRFLRRRDYRAAIRCDMSALPETQRQPAKQLMRNTFYKLRSIEVTAVLGVLLLLVTVLQFTSHHIRVASYSPQPLIVHRGLPQLDFLPWPLHAKVMYDTGITVKDLPSSKREFIQSQLFRPWHQATSWQIRQILAHLDTKAGIRWLFFANDWSGGMQLFKDVRDRLDFDTAYDADIMGLIPLENLQVIDILISLFKDESQYLRQALSTILGQIRLTNAKPVIDALTLLLQDQNNDVSSSASQSLMRIGKSDTKPVINVLIPLLQDQDIYIRISAIELLNEIGKADTKSAFNALIPLLQDQDIYIRISAIESLNEIGKTDAKPVINALIPLLQDQDADVRASAIESLGELGMAEAKPAINALIPLLQDQDADVRSNAIESLGKIGMTEAKRVINTLTPLLQDQDIDVRARASWSLGELGMAEAKPVINALIPLLRDQDIDVKSNAIESLGKIGMAEAKPIMKALILLLQDQDADVRSSAIESLRELGIADTKLVIDALIPLLQDQDDNVRSNAIESLGELGMAEAKPAINALIPLLRDQDTDVRSSVSWLLGKIGMAEAKLVINALIPLLQDQNNDVRRSASQLLGQIRLADAKPVINALIPSLQDQDVNVRKSASRSLGKIGEADAKPVINALIPLLQDQNNDVKSNASWSLGELGLADAKPVINALIPLLRDQDADVRSSASRSLGKIGEADAKPVINALIPLLQDQNNDVRRSASWSLGKIGEADAKPVINALIPLLQDQDLYVRSNAIESLGELGLADAKPVINALIPLVGDQDIDVRSSAIESLGELGLADAKPVIDALIPLLQDQDNNVRSSASRLLGRIGQAHAAIIMGSLIPVLDESDNLLYSVDSGKGGIPANPIRIQGSDEVAAAAASAFSKLLLSSLESEAPLFPALLNLLSADQSKLNARYRHAVVKALATWLDQGEPREPQANSESSLQTLTDDAPSQLKAAQEYAPFKQQIRALCYEEPKLWLRSAGCQVLVEASRLQRERSQRFLQGRLVFN